MTDPGSQPVLRLAAGDPDAPRIDGRVEVRVAGAPLALEIAAPAGPVAMETLLPVLHGLTNEVVARGTDAAEREGRRVSCAAGCGACCHQIVPLAESEVRAVARLVDAMPEPRRSAVRARFADALRRMLESDVAELIAKPERTAADTFGIATRYFALGIACPFLEDESCSIHPVRPVVCREYLVTSPPAACGTLDFERIDRVAIPAKVSAALLRASRAGGETTAWVPLIAALRFAEARAAIAPTLSAPEQLGAVFAELAG